MSYLQPAIVECYKGTYKLCGGEAHKEEGDSRIEQS